MLNIGSRRVRNGPVMMNLKKGAVISKGMFNPSYRFSGLQAAPIVPLQEPPVPNNPIETQK